MHQRTILSTLELLITLGLIYALCLSITYGQTEVSLKLINLILCISEYIKVKKSKSVYDFRDVSSFSIIALANTLVED